MKRGHGSLNDTKQEEKGRREFFFIILQCYLINVENNDRMRKVTVL